MISGIKNNHRAKPVVNFYIELFAAFFNSNSNCNSHTNHWVVTSTESAEKSYKAPTRENGAYIGL